MLDEGQVRPLIGQRIQQARIAAGWLVQAQFCREIGTDPPTLHRWEREGMIPSAVHLYNIAQACRVRMEWLLDGKDRDQSPDFLAWLETPKGKSSPEEARPFLRALPIEGYTPSHLFYDLALVAWEAGLSREEAARAARATERRRR